MRKKMTVKQKDARRKLKEIYNKNINKLKSPADNHTYSFSEFRQRFEDYYNNKMGSRYITKNNINVKELGRREIGRVAKEYLHSYAFPENMSIVARENALEGLKNKFPDVYNQFKSLVAKPRDAKGKFMKGGYIQSLTWNSDANGYLFMGKDNIQRAIIFDNSPIEVRIITW